MASRGGKNPVGRRNADVGRGKKRVGTRKNGVGTDKNRVGTDKNGVGRPRTDGVGTEKKRVGTRKDGVGKPALSHVDARGQVRMVDVGAKTVTDREAVAAGSIAMSAEARRLIRSGAVKKGDPLQAARLAGIMAAKRTSELIPLCHPLALSHISIELTPTRTGYDITARVRTSAQTGVEMEALTAVAVAALTIYDMLKAVDKAMVIGEIRLMEKRGGRSGHYHRK